tara:strand:+ start:4913 stop:5209 length:297 start_codon:yes stop_codon:yes gene_type:complete
MKSIDEKIVAIDTFLEQQTDHTKLERTLMQTIKLTEEVGELCEVVLQETGGQMRSKEDKRLDVSSEIADVMICTFLLARRLEVDIWDSLDKKLDKVLE